ncbi:hypothetical protein PV327_009907 [Microctonus hyperodae]|uniref:Uncharacterized protein n=1 Tax=Microctonus hyperodae TaxID=165561 RepID=A0AA39F1Y3_MICHY|nr:hypothetical protein PV327_009907 [Microctonus hyperodae]
MENDETSIIHGIVTKDGLFDGTVITATDEIYIEPTARYSHLLHTNTVSVQDHHHYHHHTIAYRSSDVVIPSSALLRSCTSEHLIENNPSTFIQP